MITDTLTRVFTSRPVKILVFLLVLLALASQAVPQLVDTTKYIEQISASVRTTSGATLMVKDGSQVQLLPKPALILRNIEISQPNVVRSPSMTADLAELEVSPLSLLSGRPVVTAVTLAGMSVVAEKQDTAAAQWGFMGLPLLKSLSSVKSGKPVRIAVIAGRVTVADPQTGETHGLSNLNAVGEFGDISQLSGTVAYQDTPLSFTFRREGNIGATPVSLALDANGLGSLTLKGSMDFTADYPLVTAKLDVSSPNIERLFLPPPAAAANLQENEKKPSLSEIPLKMSSDFVFKEAGTFLNGIQLEVLNSKAGGSLELVSDAKQSDRLSLAFSVLDAADAKRMFALYKAVSAAKSDIRGPRTLVDKSISLMLSMSMEKILNGAQSWSAATLDGAIADGVFTVNKLSMALPGESSLTLFGLLSVSDTQGLRFEGNTEAQGKSLRELLTVFDESAANLPELGFGAYKFRSNLFISSELMRLSEADSQFSELSFKGGLVAYFDKKPRIEADIGLRDINFDYFRNSWRESADRSSGNTMFLRFDRNMNFDWLKKLTASIDFKVDVQGFHFLERKGTNASFRLFAQTGELGIYNAKFNFGEDVTEANFKFDVNGPQPSLNLVLNTKELNTNYFALVPKPPAPPEPVATPAAPPVSAEPMPDMIMPEVAPEEELRQKIQEEAEQGAIPPAAPTLPAAPDAPANPAPPPAAPAAPPASPPISDAGKIPITDPERPAADATPAAPVTLTPLIDGDEKTEITTTPQSLLISSAQAQEAPLRNVPGGKQWSEELIDMSFMEGINGSFDISVGTLTHEDKVFNSFKMMAKLERNLLTFQTLTFMHWGGSFSINGTLFGGKVPGLSLGFIIASADLQQMLANMLNIESITGRVSLSGTIDTSGVNMLSWISQASAKLQFAGRGVSIRGFDVASVLSAVSASRTAADVFNNVNISLVGGAGDYSADGSLNMQKGAISSPGIALKTGRVVGSVSGDFRLLEWDINLTGNFRFPELATENVPTLTVRWSGPIANPTLQTDTQSLEAFVSKRITGN